MPIVAARAGVLAAFGAFVLPRTAKLICLRIQKRVQRLFHRRPDYFVQMRLNATLIDLKYRSQRLPDAAFRIFTRFNGWLHLARLRGLAPLACTNLHNPNSNQMCERNRTLSARM